jgi:hypothetical protein
MEPDGRAGWRCGWASGRSRAMREEEADWIVAARGNGYRAVEDVWRRAGLGPALTRLAEADAFAAWA